MLVCRIWCYVVFVSWQGSTSISQIQLYVSVTGRALLVFVVFSRRGGRDSDGYFGEWMEAVIEEELHLWFSSDEGPEGWSRRKGTGKGKVRGGANTGALVVRKPDAIIPYVDDFWRPFGRYSLCFLG